jgi:hypothetical protein
MFDSHSLFDPQTETPSQRNPGLAITYSTNNLSAIRTIIRSTTKQALKNAPIWQKAYKNEKKYEL